MYSTLPSLQLDWSAINLVFAEYKTRGPVILKGSDTAELIEKLEDSQMTLGSMATNRYSAPFRDEVHLSAVNSINLARVLAEPNLTAMSGQSASFLA